MQQMKQKKDEKGGCLCLEGCSEPLRCWEAGPVKAALQTKVFYSSGPNGDKWVP